MDDSAVPHTEVPVTGKAHTSNLDIIKAKRLHEAHVRKPHYRFGGTSQNELHGKMGVVDRIRQATSIVQVYKLLEQTKNMTPSAKTQKKILMAAKGAIERLGGTLRVGMDVSTTEEGEQTVLVERDLKTNEIKEIVTLSPNQVHEGIMKEIVKEPTQPAIRTPYTPEQLKLMKEADCKWKEGVFHDERDAKKEPS